ncbi:unnamed protein product [Protopolystoma xenopodis]|uniref:Uncharacterized protein n=1 Tax=Protopolystoma xenopodis TaxID=117903 RepID=A0A448WMH6_9PLAT|nr:unnamed protein product [Protopolystoma xenopodis]
MQNDLASIHLQGHKAQVGNCQIPTSVLIFPPNPEAALSAPFPGFGQGVCAIAVIVDQLPVKSPVVWISDDVATAEVITRQQRTGPYLGLSDWDTFAVDVLCEVGEYVEPFTSLARGT